MSGELSRFAGTEWRFGRGDGSMIDERLRLEANGTIRFASSANESFWTVVDGRLLFANSDREVTTEFGRGMAEEESGRELRGAFVGDATVEHVLTEVEAIIPARVPNPAPRIAVLVRTHLMNAKVDDLLKILSHNACFDLFVCADCTNADLNFAGARVLKHRVSDAQAMGLATMESGLFWWCGDYALFFAYRDIPDYDYYLMIEYDVDLPDRTPLLIEGLINRLRFGTTAPLDFVGCRTCDGQLDEGWGTTVAGFYSEVRLCLFPFVLLSRRAIDHLLAERRAEKNSPVVREQLMFCEAFVPSALHAGGFLCVDLNDLFPGSVNGDALRVLNVDHAGPMVMGQANEFGPIVQLVHPIYDEDSFVAWHVKHALQKDDTRNLARYLDDAKPGLLSEKAVKALRECLASINGERAESPG